VNNSKKTEDSGLLESENMEDLMQQVGDFYAWSRDYWIDLGRSSDGTSSGMLNFGLWEEHTDNMFDAQENLRQSIVRCLGILKSGAHGLEIGCGIGGAAIKFAQERDVVLTCMDLVPAQLEIGRELARKAELEERVEFCQGSSMDMPFPNEAFDFSYCIESSFHYPDKPAFFRESFRVLKPGAVAVIADITCENNSQVTFRKDNYFCSVEESQQLMREAGFTVEEIVRIGGQVFNPLRAYVEKFNVGRRDKLCRYWNLVLKNYAELFDRKTMGYEIFVLRKGDG
jgi:cyclopropane fatty-acyl-phospholipid synthase-like methyltransferase